MTIPISALPASLTVTNPGTVPIAIVDLLFYPGVARTLSIVAMKAPYVVDVWNGIHANRLSGVVSTAPVTADYTAETVSGGGGGGGDMLSTNNLSDVADVAAARDNLGAGDANGLAQLDATSKVPEVQLPGSAFGAVHEVATQAEMLGLATAGVGDTAIRSDVSRSYSLKAKPASTLGNWIEILTPGNTALQKAANLSDVTSPAVARQNIAAASISNILALG